MKAVIKLRCAHVLQDIRPDTVPCKQQCADARGKSNGEIQYCFYFFERWKRIKLVTCKQRKVSHRNGENYTTPPHFLLILLYEHYQVRVEMNCYSDTLSQTDVSSGFLVLSIMHLPILQSLQYQRLQRDRVVRIRSDHSYGRFDV